MTRTLVEIDEANRAQALALASFIVEAPAGSGKTELLTQRYLKLLCHVQAPEEIVAITFTNKAAAEMRSRILNSLQAAAAGEIPELPHKKITYDLSLKALKHAEDQGWALMQNPGRLRVFTIDSLSAHLARQMPLLSRFGAQPQVSEDTQSLYAQAAQQTLGLLDDAEYSDLLKTVLRYFDNDAERLQTLMIRMLETRDQWLYQAQHEVDIAAMQSALAHLINSALHKALLCLPHAFQTMLMPSARFAAANMLAETGRASPLLDWELALKPNIADLPKWRALASLLLTQKGELRKADGINIKLGYPATDEGRAHKATLVQVIENLSNPADLFQTLQLPDAPEDEAENWQMISALSQLLKLASAQLWLTFGQAGEVDFTEIASRALQALGSDTQTSDLALKLDYQISHLLVDEFQDTSPSQIALLAKLTQGWQTDEDRTLFCVGDPMQSIYRFRKANVSLFIEVAQHGIGHIKLQRLQLYLNNRASAPVVAWLNRTFAPMFAHADDADSGAIRFRESQADSNKTEGGVATHALFAWEDSAEARKQEAAKILEIIQTERAQDPHRKIAVLVSAKKHLAELVTLLRRSGNIPFQAVEIEALHTRQVVQDVLALTHALHHRADRLHWLSLLRAPWCGLTLADLYQLAGDDLNANIGVLIHDDARLAQLSPDGQTRLQHIRQVLANALSAQGRSSTSRWVRNVWLNLGGAQCLWNPADVVDIQAFFSCTAKLEAQGNFDLNRLNSEVEKLFAAPDADGKALQLMTIHKSKGLEFDTVILPGLGYKQNTGNDDKPLILWEEVLENGQPQLLASAYIPKGQREQTNASVYDFLAAREQVRDAHEAVRKLYVAATRAERKLHLVGTATVKQDKDSFKTSAPANTPLSLLWPAVEADFVRTLQQTSAPINSENDSGLAQFIPQLVRLQRVGGYLEPRETHAAYPIHTAPTAPPTHNPLTADMGTLAHRYLQLIAQQGIAAWPVSRIASLKPSMQQWLAKSGYTETDAAASQVISALQATLQSQDGQWVLNTQENAQNELAMTDAHGELHVIDRTFIETQANAEKVRWIIDYKLGLDITEQNAAIVAQSHQAQLARYAALFTQEGLPIKTAVLFLNIGKLVEIKLV